MPFSHLFYYSCPILCCYTGRLMRLDKLGMLSVGNREVWSATMRVYTISIIFTSVLKDNANLLLLKIAFLWQPNFQAVKFVHTCLRHSCKIIGLLLFLFTLFLTSACNNVQSIYKVYSYYTVYSFKVCSYYTTKCRSYYSNYEIVHWLWVERREMDWFL